MGQSASSACPVGDDQSILSDDGENSSSGRDISRSNLSGGKGTIK